MTVVAPEHEIVREALRVVDAAHDVRLRLLGGLAIEVSLPGRALLSRTYNDIDFITGRGSCSPTRRTIAESTSSSESSRCATAGRSANGLTS